MVLNTDRPKSTNIFVPIFAIQAFFGTKCTLCEYFAPTKAFVDVATGIKKRGCILRKWLLPGHPREGSPAPEGRRDGRWLRSIRRHPGTHRLHLKVLYFIQKMTNFAFFRVGLYSYEARLHFSNPILSTCPQTFIAAC